MTSGPEPFPDPPPGFEPWCRTMRGEQAWILEIDGGAPAVEVWRACRDTHAQTGLWPILIGGGPQVVDQLTWRVQILSETAPGIAPADEIADAAELFIGWLGDPGTDEYLNDVPRHLAQLAEGQDAIRERLRERPDADAVLAVRSDRVHLALVPAATGAEVPPLLAWSGGEGHGLSPEQHRSVLTLWHDAYGAEPIALGLEQLECLVTRPPEDARGAFELAVQQYAYCPQLMDNLVPAIGALAATLLGRHWVFDWT